MSFISKITPPFENQFLLENNRLRRLHGCPQLKMTRKLIQFARQWANELAELNTFKHQKQSKYGENIYMERIKNVNGKTALQKWYKEMKEYNFKKGKYNEDTRNFTQMIWKNTTEVGVGMAQKHCKVWIVAYYKTGGNFEDEFIRNVPQKIQKIICITIAPFERQCLEEHNRLRALHGCPPLTLNNQLSESAREWAKKLAYSNMIQVNKNCKYGENIFVTKKIDIDGGIPVKCWYNEIKHYSFLKGKYSENTGHFTQLIWKNTTELGIGFEKWGTTIWVVAYYKPPGNYRNEFIENVPQKIRYCS